MAAEIVDMLNVREYSTASHLHAHRFLLQTVRDSVEELNDLLEELEDYGRRLDEISSTLTLEYIDQSHEHRANLAQKAIKSYRRYVLCPASYELLLIHNPA